MAGWHYCVRLTFAGTGSSCRGVTPSTFAPGFESRLECFLHHIGEELPRSDQRQKFALYTLGLLSEAERKSVEPLAAPTRPEAPDAAHQAMLHFIVNAPWEDRPVRRRALAWGLWGATARSPVRGTILDDTGLPKQGRHSVGVQRQYTGTADKITNCQVAVTLCVFTDHDTLPLDIALYLPAVWAEDAARREKAHVPEDVVFQTKGELARAMLRAAHANGVPLGDLLLADADYGRNLETLALAGELGMKYAVGIQASQRIWDAEGGSVPAISSTADLAPPLPSPSSQASTLSSATSYTAIDRLWQGGRASTPQGDSANLPLARWLRDTPGDLAKAFANIDSVTVGEDDAAPSLTVGDCEAISVRGSTPGAGGRTGPRFKSCSRRN
jgi:hypothetical protein